MRILSVVAALAGVLFLAGCGGGGGSGPKPLPTLKTTLSSSGNTVSVDEDASAASFTVNVTSSGSASTPVIPSVSYDGKVYASVTVASGTTAGSYVINAVPQPNLGGGTYAGPITFRLCQEAACTHVYPGSTITYDYSLTVKLHEWATFQRNAAHTGYVHATLDVAKFKKAWAWTNPDSNLTYAVISANGSAYVSARPNKIYSFNEATGAQNWVNDLASPVAIYATGGMAYDKGTIYVSAAGPSTGSTFTGGSTIRGMDAATGAFRSDSPFVSQVSSFNSPTIFKDEMFYSQGYYGGVLWKYSLPAGATAWTSTYTYSNQFGGETPAVDENYVYYTTGFGLAIFSKLDGSLVANVADTLLFTTGYDNFIAPVITPSGHVIYGSPQGGSQFVAVDVASLSVIWRSTNNYNLQPVVAGNVIYGMHNYPYQVDAISDVDGNVLWSWPMPAGDTQFQQTMVVCDNLLFVITDKNTYAIDLRTHQTVWTLAEHGTLSLSSGYILYIVANDYTSGSVTSKVTAINLRG